VLRHTTEIINRRDQEVITGIFTKSPQDREQDFQSRDGKPQQNIQPITSSKTGSIGQLRMQENHLAIQLQCSNSAHQPIHKARIQLIRVCKLESQLLGTTTANQERPIGGRHLVDGVTYLPLLQVPSRQRKQRKFPDNIEHSRTTSFGPVAIA